MENIIQNISEFIESNPWFIATCVVVIINITTIIFTHLTKKLYKKQIDYTTKICKKQDEQIYELKSKKTKEEFIHNEELKNLKTKFEDQINSLSLSFNEELEKRSHFTQATIDKLRLQIKDLKDSRRKLAITIASGLTTHGLTSPYGSKLTSDELVEAAEKIYKFYTGK